MTFPGDPDRMLIVFLAKPASPSRHALDLLASWTDADDIVFTPRG